MLNILELNVTKITKPLSRGFANRHSYTLVVDRRAPSRWTKPLLCALSIVSLLFGVSDNGIIDVDNATWDFTRKVVCVNKEEKESTQ